MSRGAARSAFYTQWILIRRLSTPSHNRKWTSRFKWVKKLCCEIKFKKLKLHVNQNSAFSTFDPFELIFLSPRFVIVNCDCDLSWQFKLNGKLKSFAKDFVLFYFFFVLFGCLWKGNQAGHFCVNFSIFFFSIDFHFFTFSCSNKKMEIFTFDF